MSLERPSSSPRTTRASSMLLASALSPSIKVGWCATMPRGSTYYNRPMKWMLIKRMLVSGWKNFARGGAVSAATVLIMTVTLMIIGSLIFLSALLSFTLTTIKNKVDVSVYFVTTASESDILAVKDQLEKLPQVASVTYPSATDALAAFRARHANDQLTLQALDELGGNPLDASLEIRAKDPSQYESIVNFLDASPGLSTTG